MAIAPSLQSHESTMHCILHRIHWTYSYTQSILDMPIRQAMIPDHVSYPIVSPTATNLGLCNSLAGPGWQREHLWWWQIQLYFNTAQTHAQPQTTVNIQ